VYVSIVLIVFSVVEYVYLKVVLSQSKANITN